MEQYEGKKHIAISGGTASNKDPVCIREEKKQSMTCEHEESSIHKPVGMGAPVTPSTFEELRLKVWALEKALETQCTLNKRLEMSIKQQKQDQKQARNKSKARIIKLELENAKLLANSDAKLVSDLETLKVSLRKERVDHKRVQNKARAQFRELESINIMLHSKIKDLGQEGNGCDELVAKITSLNSLLKNQKGKHETALKRINELESHLAANTARGREDTTSRFKRPKNFLQQEEPPRIKRGIKPRYEKSTTLPVPEHGRFARPGRALPWSGEQSVNPEVHMKKVKQHGRGCLLLWPSSMVKEAEEFFQMSCMKSKSSDMPVALLAIPVSMTISWHECPSTTPWGKNTCLETCPLLKWVKERIPGNVLEEAILLTRKKGLPDATVRLNLFRTVIKEFRSLRGRWDQFCSSYDVKDLCWLCVVETVSEKGLNKNRTYSHVDVNLSGWGPPNRWERGEVAAHRKTLDECGIDIKGLLQDGMMREVIHVFSTRIYAPTNKFYYTGIESQLQLRRELCMEYPNCQAEDQGERNTRFTS